MGDRGVSGPRPSPHGAFGAEDLTAGGTLPSVWSGNWSADPRRIALIDGQDPSSGLSGDALSNETARAAAALAARGVGPHHRVMWSCFPSLDSIVALLGALRLGAVVVAVNPAVTRSELAYLTRDAEPSASIVDRPEPTAWIASGDPAGPVLSPQGLRSPTSAAGEVVLDSASPDDDALIVYTSGTTGEPKGAVHTHRSLLAGTQALRLAWGWQPDDRLILALPLFHVHGLCAGLFGSLTAGGSAIVFNRFSPALVLHAVAESTMFFGVPTMYHRLAESGRAAELSALRLCVSGSAALPADLWRRLESDHHVRVLERYGMSETLLTLSNPLHGERRPGSVGLPLPGVEAMVVRHRCTGRRRARGPRTLLVPRLLEPTRRVSIESGVRMVRHRRSGLRGRGRLLLHPGTPHGAHHHGRPQRVPRGGGGGARPTPVGRGDRRGRAALRGVGRIRHRICRWSRWGPGY